MRNAIVRIYLNIKISRQKRRCRSRPPRQSDVRDDKNVCCLSSLLADINTLEHRRIEQSLTIFYKCYKENDPSYLADLFEPRITPYNLRNTGLSVTQNSYNSKFRHNSYSFVISRIWNKLPLSVKIAPNLPSFRRKLKTLIFTGCQCKSCL